MEENLLYKVFKAKYFPYNSFLKARLGHSSSYAWKGIWSVKTKLVHGCRWRVGNGEEIDVWNKYGIPGF